MEFIRIRNVIVIFIINVLLKIKYAKQNVRVIKNSAAMQANVVQLEMFPCHVGHTFQEVLTFLVRSSTFVLSTYRFFISSRSSQYGIFDLLCFGNDAPRWFGFLINGTFVFLLFVFSLSVPLLLL